VTPPCGRRTKRPERTAPPTAVPLAKGCINCQRALLPASRANPRESLRRSCLCVLTLPPHCRDAPWGVSRRRGQSNGLRAPTGSSGVEPRRDLRPRRRPKGRLYSGNPLSTPSKIPESHWGCNVHRMPCTIQLVKPLAENFLLPWRLRKGSRPSAVGLTDCSTRCYGTISGIFDDV